MGAQAAEALSAAARGAATAGAAASGAGTAAASATGAGAAGGGTGIAGTLGRLAASDAFEVGKYFIPAVVVGATPSPTQPEKTRWEHFLGTVTGTNKPEPKRP